MSKKSKTPKAQPAAATAKVATVTPIQAKKARPERPQLVPDDANIHEVGTGVRNADGHEIVVRGSTWQAGDSIHSRLQMVQDGGIYHTAKLVTHPDAKEADGSLTKRVAAAIKFVKRVAAHNGGVYAPAVEVPTKARAQA